MSYPRYPTYKDSDVEWLGEVPGHWEIAPIKYLVRMESGGTPDKANTEYWDGDIPWASAKDLKTEKLQDTEDHISDKAVQDGAAHVISEPSILIVVRGMILAHTLPVTVNCVPTSINQDLKALHPNERLTVHYLSWLVRGLADIFLARADTAGHGTKALRTQDWNNIQLTIPPLPEQRTIAAFLDAETARIDALVAKQEALIATLQEKRRALISHAVTKGLDPAAPREPVGLPAEIEQHNRAVRQGLRERLHTMVPAAFESLIGQLLTKIGFENVTVTAASGDGGVDVRGTLVVGDVIRTRMAVQVKR